MSYLSLIIGYEKDKEIWPPVCPGLSITNKPAYQKAPWVRDLLETKVLCKTGAPERGFGAVLMQPERGARGKKRSNSFAFLSRNSLLRVRTVGKDMHPGVIQVRLC